MTKFDCGPREAEFGTYNNRSENHGDEKKKAIDLPFKMSVTMKELDIIVPLQTGKISEVLYDKKKNLQTFVLSPLHVNRKPENITVEIYDIETRANAKPLVFSDCKIKDPVLTLEPKGVYLSGKIQVSDISLEDVDRVIAGVENKKKKLQFWANAPQLALEENEKRGTATDDGENDKGDDE